MWIWYIAFLIYRYAFRVKSLYWWYHEQWEGMKNCYSYVWRFDNIGRILNILMLLYDIDTILCYCLLPQEHMNIVNWTDVFRKLFIFLLVVYSTGIDILFDCNFTYKCWFSHCTMNYVPAFRCDIGLKGSQWELQL